MKTLVLVSITALVLVTAAFGSATSVFAQSNTPENPWNANVDYPQGRGPRGGNDGLAIPGDEILHDEVIAAFSEVSGIPVADIETALDAGETLADMAVAEGFTLVEFQTMMDEAFEQALDQAVVNGDITQEQADWMKDRGNRMNSDPATRGTGTFTGTGRGAGGQGRMSNPNFTPVP